MKEMTDLERLVHQVIVWVSFLGEQKAEWPVGYSAVFAVRPWEGDVDRHHVRPL